MFMYDSEEWQDLQVPTSSFHTLRCFSLIEVSMVFVMITIEDCYPLLSIKKLHFGLYIVHTVVRGGE